MKLFKLIFFCLISTLQIAVKAENGNGGNYGGSGTTEVNVIQTGESQMISETDIKNALLYCAGNGTDNNIFMKVFKPLYLNTNNLNNGRPNFEISKEIFLDIDIQINNKKINWSFHTDAKNNSKLTPPPSPAYLSLVISNGELETLEGMGWSIQVNNCLPYPPDECVSQRTFSATNLPVIKYKAYELLPTKIDQLTGEVRISEYFFKGVTVEYNSSLPAESTLYNTQRTKSLLRFPSREMAECLRAKLSHL